jgi:hypothetical protein
MAYHAPPLRPFGTPRGSIHSVGSGSRKGSTAGKTGTEDDELLGFATNNSNFATDYGPPPLDELKQNAAHGYYDTYPKYEGDAGMEWGAVKLCALLMGLVILLITFGYYWIFVKVGAARSKAAPLAPLE